MVSIWILIRETGIKPQLAAIEYQDGMRSTACRYFAYSQLAVS